MDIADRLKELRAERNLTQVQLGKIAKIGTSSIAMIESRQRLDPASGTVKALAVALNVTTDYLLGLEDDFGQKQKSNNEWSYTTEERQIIEEYRTLSPNLQKMVRDTIKTFTTSDENKQRKEGSKRYV